MAQKNPPSQTQDNEAGIPDDADVLKIVNEYRREAEEARRDRIKLNKRNWDMYYGRQDWAHKQEGQSTEVLPKVASAVEQFSAFTKRALTQFGDWFSIDTAQNAPLDGNAARHLIKVYLDHIMVSPNKEKGFATILTNDIKAGLLESLLILKVHGQRKNETVYSSKGKTLVRGTRSVWRTRIDIIPSEDYYPDPTGRGLYEIHRVERDLVDVLEMAKQGIYDKDVVASITADNERMDKDKRRPAQRNQNLSTPPAFRKRIVIDECWGTLINLKGEVIFENGMCAIANEKYVIRKPEANPSWHGRSPILAVPIVQVPFTVWGRAVFDHASSLNQALNELFNLMLDGGIAEVWGVRQVRTDWLSDPRQVSGGIPQAATLAINENVPINGKVVESITTGSVPADAMNMFNMADREFQSASLVNDIRLGNLPQRTTKATEIIEASSNSSTMVDAIASDIETELIEPLLEMVFMNIMQNADDLAADDVVNAIGVDSAFKLSNMTAAERFTAFSGSKFKAYGLSSTLAKARDFQKLMAMMQAIGTNPVLMQAFMSKFSSEKALTFIFKSLNIDPATIENSPEEQKTVDQRLQQVQQMAQTTGGATQQPSPQAGSAGLNSEIHQNANPTGGVPNM